MGEVDGFVWQGSAASIHPKNEGLQPNMHGFQTIGNVIELKLEKIEISGGVR